MDLGDKIKAARSQKGMTQKELVEKQDSQNERFKESKIMK